MNNALIHVLIGGCFTLLACLLSDVLARRRESKLQSTSNNPVRHHSSVDKSPAAQVDPLPLSKNLLELEVAIKAGIFKMRVGRNYLLYGFVSIAFVIFVIFLYEGIEKLLGDDKTLIAVFIVFPVVGMGGFYFLWKGFYNVISGAYRAYWNPQ